MNKRTKNMVGIALLTAVVVVLQLVFGNVTIAGTPINPVLVPVVIGAALYGWAAGAWLGLASGVAILLTGAAAWFMTLHFAGTVITVLLKGTLSGLVAGLVYKLIQTKSKTLAVYVAAAVCPLVNTGIFLAGCGLFFLDSLKLSAGGVNVWTFILTAFVGTNILVEMGINMALSPVITRLIEIEKK